MSARTVAVLRALAQAGEKGLAHLATQQNTGTWISRCGRQIRGQDIRSWGGDAAGAQAEALGERFCAACRAEAVAVGGSIADGVAILLQLGPADAGVAQLLEVPLAVLALDGEPRPADEGLVTSVRQNGVLQPIVARRTPAGLRVVAGGRRLDAARAAGLETIPTIVRDLDDEHTTIEQLLSNLHREDLDPIAQALAYADALAVLGVQQKQLADGLGISPSQVSNTLRLLKLPPHLREHVAARLITAEQARALLACSSAEEQDALADQFLAGRAVRRSAAPAPLDPQLAAIADLLAQVVEAKVAIRTRGTTTEFVFRVPTAERDRLLATLTPAA